MKNQKLALIKKRFLVRWLDEDYPGGEPRFQVSLLAKDVATYVGIPLVAIFLFKSIENAAKNPRKAARPESVSRDHQSSEQQRSQIIEFKVRAKAGSISSAIRRSPGSLIRLKLLNVVETYSTAPVHAQIVDAGLGKLLLGGTLIGDATPDSTFERITITFRYVRDPNRDAIAYPINARALGLDGTLGLIATKKEGFVTRSVLGSAQSTSQELQGKSNPTSLGDILVKALSAGLVQEFGSETQVEKNRAQVLTIRPGTEFFAELTDFFPGSSK